MIKVAFYDTKEYDKPSFERYGGLHDMQFRFLETKLNEDTVDLARGCDAVCVFVNERYRRRCRHRKAVRIRRKADCAAFGRV